jgi:hypothetical protein
MRRFLMSRAFHREVPETWALVFAGSIGSGTSSCQAGSLPSPRPRPPPCCLDPDTHTAHAVRIAGATVL